MDSGAPRDYLLLIGGDWTPAEGGATLDSVDPSTGEVWAAFEGADWAGLTASARGLYYSPTILTGVDPGSDVKRAHRMASALHAGTVWINTYRAVSPLSPSSGSDLSGHGRENGAEAIAAFTKSKSVWVELSEEVQDPFVLRV
jgi:acyl-CoA reductase-like NAD-dependent aldehyde dehydrogenase